MMGEPIVKVSVVAIMGLEGVESEQNILNVGRRNDKACRCV